MNEPCWTTFTFKLFYFLLVVCVVKVWLCFFHYVWRTFKHILMIFDEHCKRMHPHTHKGCRGHMGIYRFAHKPTEIVSFFNTRALMCFYANDSCNGRMICDMIRKVSILVESRLGGQKNLTKHNGPEMWDGRWRTSGRTHITRCKPIYHRWKGSRQNVGKLCDMALESRKINAHLFLWWLRMIHECTFVFLLVSSCLHMHWHKCVAIRAKKWDT